jgi:uncharacterized lipoprotein YmbA
MTLTWMRRTGWLGCSVLLGCGGLPGCGTSPPTRFYILNDIAAPAATTPVAAPVLAAAPAPIAVQVGRVTIAPELDRPELVTRSGPNRVRVADFERWAAPLAEQIRRVLAANLASRLAPGLIASADQPAGSEPRRTLSVAIEEFYGDDSCAVNLRAGWSLTRPNAASLHGSEQLQLPGRASCGEQLPAAMSQALAVLADRLAQVIVAD